MWSEVDDNSPLILIVSRASDKVSLYQAINQFDSTMVFDLKPLGQLTDRCFPSIW